MGIKTERIEARFSPEIKALAERAALANGQTLTDYLATLVKTDAPNRLKAASDISLMSAVYRQPNETVCGDENDSKALSSRQPRTNFNSQPCTAIAERRNAARKHCGQTPESEKL